MTNFTITKPFTTPFLAGKLRRHVLCLGLVAPLALTALPSAAQVQIDTLQPASQFDVGMLDAQNGGLDVNLWNDTSAKRATLLINAVPLNIASAAKPLVDAALLSSGIPPQSASSAEMETFQAAKLGALIGFGNLDAYQQITARTPIRANSAAFVTLNVNKALLDGNTDKACDYADSIKDKTQRKTPYWAKLRSFCHIVRGELPAAELTADLIKRSKHKDAGFFALLPILTMDKISLGATSLKAPLKTLRRASLGSPLHRAMIAHLVKNAVPSAPPANIETAKDEDPSKNVALPSVRQILKFPSALAAPLALHNTLPAQSRLAALHQGASALNVQQIETVLAQLSEADDGEVTDVKTLTETRQWTPTHWSDAFTTIRSGTDAAMNTQAASALLAHADRAGILGPISQVLARDLGGFSAGAQAEHTPEFFAQIAAQKGDILALQTLHSALEADHALRGRIALASDALGNGFMLNPLGRDIDERLADSETQANALRDAHIALALGATFSDEAVTTLLNDTGAHKSKTSQNYGAMLALQEAAHRRAPAQSALLAAQVLGDNDTSALSTHSFYLLLRALNEAGLGQFSRQLAAQDFLAR